MGQKKFHCETGRTAPVPFPVADRREQIAWLKDFLVGLAIAASAGAAFAWVMSFSQAAWAALR